MGEDKRHGSRRVWKDRRRRMKRRKDNGQQDSADRKGQRVKGVEEEKE